MSGVSIVRLGDHYIPEENVRKLLYEKDIDHESAVR